MCADQGMGPSKRGGGEGEDGKRARAEAGGQAQDGVPDTAGELSAKAPAGGEVGQRAAVVQDPAAQDPAPARSRGSDDLTDPDEHGLHGIDRAHELLLALQNRTGNGPDKDEPGRRCVTAGRNLPCLETHTGVWGCAEGRTDRMQWAVGSLTRRRKRCACAWVARNPPSLRGGCLSRDGVTAGRGNERGCPGVRGAEGVGGRLRCVGL